MDEGSVAAEDGHDQECEGIRSVFAADNCEPCDCRTGECFYVIDDDGKERPACTKAERDAVRRGSETDSAHDLLKANSGTAGLITFKTIAFKTTLLMSFIGRVAGVGYAYAHLSSASFRGTILKSLAAIVYLLFMAITATTTMIYRKHLYLWYDLSHVVVGIFFLVQEGRRRRRLLRRRTDSPPPAQSHDAKRD